MASNAVQNVSIWWRHHVTVFQVSLDQTYRFIGVIAQGGLLEGGDPWSNPGVEEFKVQYSVDNLAWTTVQNSTNGDEVSSAQHDDVMTWKRFPHYWAFGSVQANGH